jgi:hypothetical protein
VDNWEREFISLINDSEVVALNFANLKNLYIGQPADESIIKMDIWNIFQNTANWI